MMASSVHDEDRPDSYPDGSSMATYGITRVPVDYFHYREFRYTNLKDAIAQAKRDHTVT